MPRGQRTLEDATTTRLPGGGIVPGIGFTVKAVDGPDAGRTVTIDAALPKRLLVGKGPTCDLRLRDPLVSRRHAALELTGLRLTVSDLGSTNGTTVNDVAVETAHLRGGEIVRVGATTLKVDLCTTSSSAAEAPIPFGRLVGRSPQMRIVYELAPRFASADVPVVLEGDTGTGKELLAECIHEASARQAGPFVVFDCAATPRAEMERALFGERSRDGGPGLQGLYELAHRGTLLLDELGDLSIDAQGALLRVIERGELRRLGDDRVQRVDVRTLATTRKDLEDLVEKGAFREDLFFRLVVGRIELPPLRRRVGDAALLAAHFFATLGGGATVPAEFEERFHGYHWPGNVRELQNAVARFLALGPASSLVAPRTPIGVGTARGEPQPASPFAEILEANLSFPQARQRVLDQFERAYVERVLAAHNGNVARAAAASGIARRYFQLVRARQGR